MMRQVVQSRDQVREALDRVAAREEFRKLLGKQSEEKSGFWKWLDDFFSDSGSDSSVAQTVGSGFSWLPAVLACIVVVAILVFVVRAFMVTTGKADQQEETLEDRRAQFIAEQLRLGAAARQAGQLNLALRAYWSALVTGVGRGDDLVFRTSWTCREMLARSPIEASDVQLVAGLLEHVERLEFGDEVICTGDVDELAALCTERLT